MSRGDGLIENMGHVIEDAVVAIEIVRALSTPMFKGRAAMAPQESRFIIHASVQPIGRTDLLQLPEGMREDGAIKLYTEIELFTVRQSEAKVPDRFDYRGATYEVSLIDDWKDFGNYFKVIATRTNR